MTKGVRAKAIKLLLKEKVIDKGEAIELRLRFL